MLIFLDRVDVLLLKYYKMISFSGKCCLQPTLFSILTVFLRIIHLTRAEAEGSQYHYFPESIIRNKLVKVSDVFIYFNLWGLLDSESATSIVRPCKTNFESRAIFYLLTCVKSLKIDIVINFKIGKRTSTLQVSISAKECTDLYPK